MNDYDTFEEELPINQEDQEYAPDDSFDPRECDRAAEIWERQFLDNESHIGSSFLDC